MIRSYLFVFVLGFASFLLISLLLKSILLYIDSKLTIKRKVEWKEAGTWIGLCEFVLIFLFVFLEEYTAIAIIFAAKELVRSEDIKRNPTYYLLGTLLNVTLSVLTALLFKHFIIPQLIH
ncbi:MAG: hypothetical protein HYZ34_03125 [Ignavibacteriae bacterium]|nr:hypothetical protein [Ignavibacteriota bacterium]